MLTASHNPPTDNGIKFFVDGQEYTTEDENRVETAFEQEHKPANWADWGQQTRESIIPDYRAAVVEYARQFGESLEDTTVAVDCGNGVGALGTPHVLRRLGADVHTLHANIDGHFPGRRNKPTTESLRDLCKYVAERDEISLGVGHDGDADRIVVVDSDGSIVHEDTVLAVMAEHYTRDNDADDPVVVTTPNVSARVDDRVKAHGGRVVRTALGTLHEGIADVVESGDDRTEVVFASEPWKCIHPKFGIWTDGIATAAVLSRLVAAEGLDTLTDPVVERPLVKDPVDCPESAKAAVMEDLETELPEQYPDGTVSLEYGVRIELPDGSWFLVRPSGTEPYIRVYVESDDVDSLIEDVTGTVESIVARVS
jgi:phosphomannomutase